MKPAKTVVVIPHDWTFKRWPSDVYPYDGIKGRHLVNQNRERLVAAGALVRVGKTLVILSAGYFKWLRSNSVRVMIPEYEPAGNRPQHAAKRFGHTAESNSTN